MKLSDMREVLGARDIQLTKSLGQNFLHDQNQLRRIVDAAELTPQDRVLEIGPGLGPLTELLLSQSGHVLAIEKDRIVVACGVDALELLELQREGGKRPAARDFVLGCPIHVGQRLE